MGMGWDDIYMECTDCWFGSVCSFFSPLTYFPRAGRMAGCYHPFCVPGIRLLCASWSRAVQRVKERWTTDSEPTDHLKVFVCSKSSKWGRDDIKTQRVQANRTVCHRARAGQKWNGFSTRTFGCGCGKALDVGEMGLMWTQDVKWMDMGWFLRCGITI